MIRSGLLWLLLAGLAQGIAAAPPRQVVVLVDNGYPPYSYEKDGRAEGVYNEVLREASQRLSGYRIELRPVPWKRGLSELEAGRAPALSPPYYRPERDYMGYSAPFWQEQLAVYCRADIMRAPRPHWPADFLGLRFGNNAGFRPGGKAFWLAVQRGEIHLDEAPDTQGNLLKLVNGRIDCYLNDKLSILYVLDRLQRRGVISAEQRGGLAAAASLNGEQAYVGFAKRGQQHFPYLDDFIRQLNAVLEQMKREGRIAAIVEQTLRAPPP
ncbi:MULTISPECIES: substrate-binding periplasmic protein [Chromobacterium]|uniref:substrate-binding periplasmic protein n=1 Tax=Chromobacterium TaxID=535 RepID=UPI0005BDACF4|nr:MULTISPECIES: transporter substrate-binding domain-containing protein [Chromobacterium]MDH0341390.1 transporter substrate-binding domain-containing protein [Chromobacterium haemolyticum]WON82261.1 transporter substrate-binding domain-containing protein [Chromobacterium haemolyticum]